ncbi:PAAR domain-containing protein [Vibrio cholerae]|nr:PAAR domain-containing protein [Vibrio cholerae]
MPGAARLGDIGSEHDCFPPTPIIAGSGDVFIDDKPAVRQGDNLEPHGDHSRAATKIIYFDMTI